MTGPDPGDSIPGMEAGLAAIVLSAMRSWLAAVRDSVFRTFQEYGSRPDVDAILAQAQDWIATVDTAILPYLADAGRVGWRRSIYDIPVPRNEAFMAEHLRRARNLLVRIPDEIYARVNKALQDSVARGDDVHAQAAAVDRVLDATGSENWPNRAKVVAVTEVNRAYQAGALQSGYALQVARNRTLFKKWDATNDMRVREAHHKADGQIQPLNTPFRVGSSRLMYPGDPDGAPEDVINCRCELRFLGEER